MPSPIGERLERFPLDMEVIDTDPSGNVFIKRSWWDDRTLVTRAVDQAGKKADFLTRRYFEEAKLSGGGEGGTRLVQHTVHDGVEFTRWFERKPKK